MIAKKRKITKKQIKEDKLVTTYYKTVELFNEYKQQILIGVAALAIILFGIFWYVNSNKEKNREATIAISKVLPLYNSGSYQEAIDGKPGTDIIGLKQIVEDYGGTEQGNYAKIYLANSYYYLGKYDEALKYYEDYSGDNEIFKATAYAGIAACYEAMGKHEDAAEYFEKAANVSQFNAHNPEYILNAAINYLESNEKDKAKELFQVIRKKYKKSFIVREAERYLSILA